VDQLWGAGSREHAYGKGKVYAGQALADVLSALQAAPDFAYTRVVAGQSMPGVFVVPDRMAVRQAIEELWLVEACSEQAE